MAGSFDDKGSGSGEPGKRPAPTIEGTATEVTVEPKAQESAAKDEPPAAPGEAAAKPANGDEAAGAGTAPDNGMGGDEPPETDAPADTEPAPRPRRAGSVLSHLTAGLLGGLAGAGAIAFAWSYLPAPEPAETTDLKPLEDRLAALEAAPDAPDSGPELATLEQRLAALEGQDPETPPELAALSDRVTQLEASLNAMADAAKDGGSIADAAIIGQQIGEAEARLEAKIADALAKTESADDAAIAALKKDIAAVDAKLRALAEAELSGGEAARLVPELAVLDERLGKIEAALPILLDAVDREAAETKAATLAIAFANLRAAVDEGRPYAPELATLAALAPGNGDLGELLDYEDKGIPTLRELTASFKQTREAALSASAPDADASIVDRLIASAESLVKVRRIDAAAEGDAPDAVLARAEAKLEAGDLAASVREVEKLQGAPRAAFADWLDQARARLGAEVTLQRLQSILLVSLGGSAASGEHPAGEQQD